MLAIILLNVNYTGATKIFGLKGIHDQTKFFHSKGYTNLVDVLENSLNKQYRKTLVEWRKNNEI